MTRNEAGLPAYWRPLASTLVTRRDSRRPNGLAVKIPGAVLDASGIKGPGYISWARAGDSYRVSLHGGRAAGAAKLKPRMRAALPGDVVEAMRLCSHDTMDWVLAVSGGRIHVYAKKAAPGTGRPAPPAGPGPGRTLRRRLATARVYERKAGKYGYLQTTVPVPCIRVLLALDATHVRWEEAKDRLRMVPCKAGDGGARRLIRARKEGRVSHLVVLPRPAALFLYSGPGSEAAWHAVSDGRGWWGMEVGRA